MNEAIAKRRTVAARESELRAVLRRHIFKLKLKFIFVSPGRGDAVTISMLYLRREVKSILERTRRGERMILTYRGKPVARLEPIVDTSGFYALLLKRDDRHDRAKSILEEAGEKRRRFVKTDYVLDEMGVLLKARGPSQLVADCFDIVMESKACRIEWTDARRFDEAKIFFLKHLDQQLSFTDCLSFCVMKGLGLVDALTKDHDFRSARFTPLLT